MKERWIAVIAAEEQELAGMDGFMEDRRTETGAAGCVYRMGRVGSHQVAAMRCGIGKVNAAISAQAMIDRFQPEALINIGAAGAVAPGISLYDLVISEDVVQHDMDVTGLGYAPGIVPDQEESFFKADPGLIVLADQAGSAEGLKTHMGRIASGDLFVSEEGQRQRIHDTFHALCAEMEGAAIAQACWRNRVPFVILRSISDNADGNAGVSYAEFSEKAAGQAVRLLSRMLKTWS